MPRAASIPLRRTATSIKILDPAPQATTIEEVREQARRCTACFLWKIGTQTVFGEGPAPAEVMLVGEQPGDKEDLAGRPFVGPAGTLLDRALKDVGIDRTRVYVTNAVKHFKFERRGKIRLHKKPGTIEVVACRPWLEKELDLVQPKVVVALGATAVQSVFGRAMPINKNRGHFLELATGRKALITVHPSFLLRQPDEESRRLEYRRFVADLKLIKKA